MLAPYALAVLVLPLAQPQDPTLGSPAEQTARNRAHYARVVQELSAADVSGLEASRRAERARLLDVLRAYNERADFGRSSAFPGARMPHFVDDEGRRCAVAELLHACGEDSLVERVRTRANHAWVVDLGEDPSLEAWLDRCGLTLWEAARIQGPPVVTTPPAPQPTAPPPTTFDGTRSGGTSARSTAAAIPAASAPPSGGSGGGQQGAAPTAPWTDADSAWWLWWEYNKLEYLRPNTLSARAYPRTGDGGSDVFDDQLDSLRRVLEPRLVAALGDSDANVRASAAIALGRTAGATAVEPLLALLDDRSRTVRHRALLALGATGAQEAQSLLMHVAREGTLPSGESVTPLARPLAIVALGLGRRAGFDERVDVEVARLLEKRPRAERERLGIAGLMYHTLAPCAALEEIAVRLADDAGEPQGVRSRALESLRSATAPGVLSDLQHALHGSRLESRRSAALALGDFAHPLASAALLTAFETEAEPTARGFLLIAIGRQGGPEALDFLADTLRDGKHAMRPWAALGLGLLAHERDDAEVGDVLRKALARERNRDTQGAFWLALGLAGDVEALQLLSAGLAEAADPRQRMYAATALSLIGGAAVRAALLERLELEPSAMARVAIVQALGILGRQEDAPALYRALRRLNTPELRGLAASALAFHGSSGALAALHELERSRTSGDVTRAAAYDGLGLMLGRTPSFALGELSRASNFTLYSDWVDELFQSTL
ncbi:MAG TPA: HEAT repeat domain-containing protein [Planctomycetota bacterium]|nr:HEAT repeat domain-containing protein [Planctomycetota bacterium]